jgi:hypothetical protein
MNNAAHLVNTSPTKALHMPGCAGHLFQANLPRRLALPLLLLCAVLLARPCAATPGEWDFTGSLNTARYLHTATLLADGKVLVVGGRNPDISFASAELYDPATGNWTPTGSLTTGRYLHTATLLADGKVLVAGGYLRSSGPLASAELYDPATGIWTLTGSLHTARYFHTATLLPDGEVLVVGGADVDGFTVGSAELYNPATGTWTTTGFRYGFYHTATRLADGRVLVAGGYDQDLELYLKGVSIYDQTTGKFTSTGSLLQARSGHVATLLPSGKVLVAGGEDDSGGLLTAEIYDPATGLWTATGNLLPTGSTDATLLPNGKVLVAGFSGAQLYDPATGTWTATGSLNTARTDFSMTSLPSGMVLVAGGLSGPRALASAELYDPGMAVTATMASGRGSIAGQGDAATFNFRTNLTGDRPSGSLTFSDAGAGISISRAKVRTLTFTGNSADFGGNARLGDGTRVTFSVSITDNSSDGGSDSFNISLSNGYSAGGTLTSGDIQIQ